MRIGTRGLGSATRVKSVSSTVSKQGSKSNMLQSSLDEIKEDAMDSDEDTMQVQNNQNLGEMDFALLST